MINRILKRPTARRHGIALLIASTVLSSPVFAQSSASDHTFATRYDSAGRVVGTIAPDPDGAGSLGYAATRTTYNAQGFATKVESGYLTTWKSENYAPAAWTTSEFKVLNRVETDYDVGGRKIEERSYGVNGSTSTLIARTNFSYDNVGRLECTARRMNLSASVPASACALGNEGSDGPDRITKNVYDAAGQVTKVQRAVGTSIQQDYVQYTYDDNGNKLTVTDANGNKAQYAYDGHDRLEYWYFPSKTTIGQHSTSDYEKYGYDANGNMTSKRTRRDHTILYEYDALNRMTKKNLPDDAGISSYLRRDVYYGYDLQGLQLYARYWGHEDTREGITNIYDGFGRLASSELDMNGLTKTISHQYNRNGVRTELTHDDGQRFEYFLDGLDRVTGIYKWGTAKFADFSYDSRGNRSSRTARGNYVTSTNIYDVAGRLTGLSHNVAGTGNDVSWTYGYNPAGQTDTETLSNTAYKWVGFAEDTVPYQVNGLNQYTSVDGASFTYDANGNLTSDGVTTYQYDMENRMIRAQASGKDVLLQYDPMGRLRHVLNNLTGAKTLFEWDGDELVTEYDGSGNIIRRHLHGAGVDDPVTSHEGTSYLYANMSNLVADRQGSIVALTDDDGNVTDRNAYDSYGVPMSPTSASAMVGRFGYTGQAWIPELGLWHYKARFYSPTLGRFMQVDPIGYEDQVNLYAYVGNDPVNFFDPTGNEAWPVCASCLWESAKSGAKKAGETAGAAADWWFEDTSQAADDFERDPSLRNAGRVLIAITPLGKAKKLDKAADSVDTARRTGRGRNHIQPDTRAEGPHSVPKRDADGNVTGYAEYKPNPRNPSGHQEVKRVDGSGAPHRNPDGTIVDTPHVHEPGRRGVRRPTPEEWPDQSR